MDGNIHVVVAVVVSALGSLSLELYSGTKDKLDNGLDMIGFSKSGCRFDKT